MKMKIGISIVVAVACSYLVYSQKRKVRYNYFNDVSENYFKEYAKDYNPQSSFIEFFDKENIKEAFSRYDKYLDLGLNKEDAFKSVVEDKRNK
jgi:hypothetical protein